MGTGKRFLPAEVVASTCDPCCLTDAGAFFSGDGPTHKRNPIWKRKEVQRKCQMLATKR